MMREYCKRCLQSTAFQSASICASLVRAFFCRRLERAPCSFGSIEPDFPKTTRTVEIKCVHGHPRGDSKGNPAQTRANARKGQFISVLRFAHNQTGPVLFQFALEVGNHVRMI